MGSHDLFSGWPVLITGGAGFIGCNLADRLLSDGCPVLVFDNLSRAGVEQNLDWLRRKHPGRVQIEMADVRDRYALRRAVQRASQVFHLAAQVAVTTSLSDPVEDFEVNLVGTLNLLEELRALDHPPPLIYTSTNKVYGHLDDLSLRASRSRYEPRSPRGRSVAEDRPLSFQSPYGCSKGAADQYVVDYARSFGLPAAVFRMSCIYGPHQFGTEDQGWVAHFLIRALEGRPVSIYGTGLQVRDLLFIEDLVDALLLAQRHIAEISGSAFNIGGGAENTVSLLELMGLINDIHGSQPKTHFEPWRVADQRYYVSDTTKFHNVTGWSPRVGVREGVARLYRWLAESRPAAVYAGASQEAV
jgi:CDP-paratose 2-epimerase